MTLLCLCLWQISYSFSRDFRPSVFIRYSHFYFSELFNVVVIRLLYVVVVSGGSRCAGSNDGGVVAGRSCQSLFLLSSNGDSLHELLSVSSRALSLDSSGIRVCWEHRSAVRTVCQFRCVTGTHVHTPDSSVVV